MDPFVRQQGQHIEYDPHYKSRSDMFSLQLFMATCSSVIVDWCASDRFVFLKCYPIFLDKLSKNMSNHSAYYSNTNILSSPVSIHFPLTRCLTALYLHLQKFNLKVDSRNIRNPKPSMFEIMEPILRIQLLRAQVKAGMWVRNGQTLLKNLGSYHGVTFRTEMLDQDIILLQIVASQIESNKFLTHILNKFHLINSTMPSLEIRFSEDNNNKTLIEEFLHLLIVIVGERYVSGVSFKTTEERIKKEIIQYLCIKPVPYSQLINAVPENLILKIDKVDKLIEEVAVLDNSSFKNGKPVYKLKDPYYEEYNVYFYHYTANEMSEAEEFQKNIRKSKGQTVCCPPPTLPKLTKCFEPLINIFHCDVMLQIIRLILKGYIEKQENYSESQIHMILHFIGYALLEEETKNYSFLRFVENATKLKIFDILNELLTSDVADCQKELLQWVLLKYEAICHQNDEHVILQTTTNHEKLESEKEKRAQLIAERKIELLEQMRKMQQKFVDQNLELYEVKPQEEQESSNQDQSNHVTEILQEHNYVAFGPQQSTEDVEEKTYICIFCQEEEKVTVEGPSMTMPAFVYQAATLTQHIRNQTSVNIHEQNAPYLQNNLGPAPHISTCGHIMHFECWKTYLVHQGLKKLEPFTTFELEKYEYLCPLCGRLCNSILPILPPLSSLLPNEKTKDVPLDKWLHIIHNILSSRTSVDQMHNTLLNYHEHEVNLHQADSHKEMIQLSAWITSTAFNNNSQYFDTKISPINWKSFAYTMHSTEILLRYSNQPLLGQLSFGYRDFLENLTKLMSVLGDFLPESGDVHSHALKLLTILFEHSGDCPSIFHWDSFGFLVSLTFSLRKILRNVASIGGTLDLFLLRTMFACHITKIIIFLRNNIDSFGNDDDDSEPLIILNIIGKKTQSISHLLWKHIKNACVPFLRCCVLFYYHLTNVPAPAKLNEVGGDTFENMCSYLDLPQTPKDLFGLPEVIELVKRWSNHKEIVCYLDQNNLYLVSEPRPMPRLIELPSDYCELIKVVLNFKCSEHDLVSDTHYICLLCGEILCFCTQLTHAIKCGAGIGVVLNITECEVLLHAGPDLGCYMSAPYIDDHGETDEGFIRGNRLKLCPKRYEHLETLWLSHRIHETIFRVNNEIGDSF